MRATEPTLSRRPIGVIAFVLALGLTLLAAVGFQTYAFGVASDLVPKLLTSSPDIKWQSLVLQRAALADPNTLVAFGSSELSNGYSGRYQPIQFFASKPTGFRLFAVAGGGILAADYFQDLAALGRDLQNRPVVISDSWNWYFFPTDLSAKAYAAYYQPEMALAFAFDAPLTADTRQKGARRMLDYPDTLASMPVLRIALNSMASPSWESSAAYTLVYPAGKLESWFSQLQDAYRLVVYSRDQHPLSSSPSAGETSAPKWDAQLAAATRLAVQRSAGNPLWFDREALDKVEGHAEFNTAWNRACSPAAKPLKQSATNVAKAETTIRDSPGWGDLELELGVVADLQAHPLVYVLPPKGPYYDLTNSVELSEQPRAFFYSHYGQTVTSEHVPVETFSEFDGDRYFEADDSSHLSARGAVFVDRVIDLFWHGSTTTQIDRTLGALSKAVPPPSGALQSNGCNQASTSTHSRKLFCGC